MFGKVVFLIFEYWYNILLTLLSLLYQYSCQIVVLEKRLRSTNTCVMSNLRVRREMFNALFDNASIDLVSTVIELNIRLVLCVNDFASSELSVLYDLENNFGDHFHKVHHPLWILLFLLVLKMF